MLIGRRPFTLVHEWSMFMFSECESPKNFEAVCV
jgi:hypothetical protein